MYSLHGIAAHPQLSRTLHRKENDLKVEINSAGGGTSKLNREISHVQTRSCSSCQICHYLFRAIIILRHAMTMRHILSWGYSGGGWGTANQGIGFLQPDLVSQCAGRDVLSSRCKEFRPTWLRYSQDSINQVSNKRR